MATPPASELGGMAADAPHPGPEVRPGRSRSTRPPSGRFEADRIGKRLGWFSIALGSIEVLAPGVVSRAIGTGRVPLARAVIRVRGLREIAAGVGIVMTPRPAGWVTARVGGDVMDLGLLAAAFAWPWARRGRLLVVTAVTIGALALDAKYAQQLSGQSGMRSGSARVSRRVTVNRPAEELYRFWRDFSNLPRFMQRIESVHPLDERRSHWRASAPGGLRIEWDAEVTDERPSEWIAWRSLPGAQLDTSGVVRFEPAPADRGTEVIVELEYTPPGGDVTAQLLKLAGQSPAQQLQGDLRRFKQLMETGQIVVAEGVLQGVRQPPDGRGRWAHTRDLLSMLRGGVR